jgi:hypothetical protein
MKRLATLALCASLALSLTAFTAGTGDGPSKKQVDRAAAELDAAIKGYLSTKPSGPQSDPSTWAALFDLGDRRVADLRKKFENWVSLSNKRIAAGHRPQQGSRFGAYQRALAVWVADQEQQATLSRSCFERSGSFVDLGSARACYGQLLATNGARWQADADHLNRAARALRSGSS